MAEFMFATGIENSYPVVTGKKGENVRRDELESTGFYRRWREDFELLAELGVEYLRYGPQYYRVHTGDGRYDWGFADETFARLKELNVTPIADLCHFGLPDWIGDFQNPDWPELFAAYASAFASRFPWVRLMTPVNEIFVNSTFSALHGWWNERLKSDRAFVTALRHMCKATLRAEEEILKVQPEAIFIQSEATAYYHQRSRKADGRARCENEKRFLSFDLCYGNRVGSEMYEYLMDNGLTRAEYHWFLDHGPEMRPHCVMGSDYYGSNEHWVPAEGPIESAGPVFGYAILARQYYERYHLPVMLTETNTMDAAQAPAWLHHQWACVRELRRVAIPVMGFTWYSLLDQVDWDVALREVRGTENPVGLYDLNRHPHPARDAYRDLVAEWRGEMPMLVEYGNRYGGHQDGSDRRPNGRGGKGGARHGGDRAHERKTPVL
jgi:beta-glucosidase/6-phospho-beta-glucosidase/beta-galactosidase